MTQCMHRWLSFGQADSFIHETNGFLVQNALFFQAFFSPDRCGVTKYPPGKGLWDVAFPEGFVGLIDLGAQNH